MADARDTAAETAANRDLWTRANRDHGDEHADRAWAAEGITWGIFNVPERQLGVLGDVRGLDVVELGCGTGPARRELPRPQREARRLVTAEGGTQFHPGHAEWIAILRASRFAVDDLRGMGAQCVPSGTVPESRWRVQAAAVRVTPQALDFHDAGGA